MLLTIMIFVILNFIMLMATYGVLGDIRKLLQAQSITDIEQQRKNYGL